MLGVEPATGDGPGGWPLLIREDRESAPGDTPLHLATGIQHPTDARSTAAAPDLAAALLRVLTSPALTWADLDPETHVALVAAWRLWVEAAPHLEVWPSDPPPAPGSQ